MGQSSSDAEPTLRGYAAGQRVFGRYILQRILGRGGMGVVWRARDECLGEDIALKFLPDAVRWDPGAFEDLKAETRRARQLTHPNIVRIHDFVEDESGAAISMELVDGCTLTALRLEKANKFLEPAEIAAWLPHLCAALDYAHTQAKVVHRDLKPSNIMLTRDGVVKVGDFGIARSLADSITRVSMMSAGTLVYMSPQQAMGEEPAPSDDIYSLGATLYELLAGKPPFHTGDVRVQLFQRRPDSIAARRKGMGFPADDRLEPWDRTIAACLAKNAEERPSSAGELVQQLFNPDRRRAVRGGAQPMVRRSIPWSTLVAAAARNWKRAAIALVVMFAAFAAWRWWPRAVKEPVWPSDALRALGAWNFDGDGRDASGHGLDAVGATGIGATIDRDGRIERALHFNGHASLYTNESPALAWAGDEPFTVAIWVKPGTGGADGGFLVGNVPAAVSDNKWALELVEGARPRFLVARVQQEGGSKVDASESLRAREWSHLAGVSDGRVLRLFVNGSPSGEVRLSRTAIGGRPAAVQLRIGMEDVYGRAGFSGDLDDLRLWRRALEQKEIAALASRDAAPRFVVTRGNYSEREDLAAAVVREFGADASLGDWNDLRRWHRDDIRALCDELGLVTKASACLVSRGGQRIWQEPRHYLVQRLDGVKPDYFEAHDEMGGMALALGSWHGLTVRVLCRLPSRSSRHESLEANTSGAVARQFSDREHVAGFAISWHADVARNSRATRCHVRLRDGRTLAATYALNPGDRLALALGDDRQPEIAREMNASWGHYVFTVVLRDGLMRFRAVNPTGGAPLFQESIPLPALRATDVAELSVANVDAAELIIE